LVYILTSVLGCSPLTSNHWTHKRPIVRFTIWYILSSVLGCSPLTSSHWTHKRPIIRFTIWYILTSVLGCSPLTSNRWTHKRPIIRFTIWYILTSVFRMFTSDLKSLNTWKTNNTLYNMIYTYFCFRNLCSVIWGERRTS
jgi:uncharacterized OsmC-like protein